MENQLKKIAIALGITGSALGVTAQEGSKTQPDTTGVKTPNQINFDNPAPNQIDAVPMYEKQAYEEWWKKQIEKMGGEGNNLEKDFSGKNIELGEEELSFLNFEAMTERVPVKIKMENNSYTVTFPMQNEGLLILNNVGEGAIKKFLEGETPDNIEQIMEVNGQLADKNQEVATYESTNFFDKLVADKTGSLYNYLKKSVSRIKVWVYGKSNPNEAITKNN